MDLNDIGIGTRVKHPSFGVGIVAGMDVTSLDVFFKDHGDKEIAKSFEGLEIIQLTPNESNMLTLGDVERSLKKILAEFSDVSTVIELGEKWKGGKVLFQPFDPDLKPKEVPINTFFHKIVMLRDRLRVLEQNINSHKVLEDQDKVHLQQYITRIYGTLTTFNVLFKHKEDHFKGEGKG